ALQPTSGADLGRNGRQLHDQRNAGRDGTVGSLGGRQPALPRPGPPAIPDQRHGSPPDSGFGDFGLLHRRGCERDFDLRHGPRRRTSAPTPIRTCRGATSLKAGRGKPTTSPAPPGGITRRATIRTPGCVSDVPATRSFVTTAPTGSTGTVTARSLRCRPSRRR